MCLAAGLEGPATHLLQLLEVLLLEGAWPPSVSVVHLLVGLVASHLNFLCIDDYHVAPHVHAWCVASHSLSPAAQKQSLLHDCRDLLKWAICIEAREERY